VILPPVRHKFTAKKPPIGGCRNQSGKPSPSFTLPTSSSKLAIHNPLTGPYPHAGCWLNEASQQLVVTDLYLIDHSAEMSKLNVCRFGAVFQPHDHLLRSFMPRGVRTAPGRPGANQESARSFLRLLLFLSFAFRFRRCAYCWGECKGLPNSPSQLMEICDVRRHRNWRETRDAIFGPRFEREQDGLCTTSPRAAASLRPSPCPRPGAREAKAGLRPGGEGPGKTESKMGYPLGLRKGHEIRNRAAWLSDILKR
jgi:hypothetical protein